MARELLAALKRNAFVLDWRKKQMSRAKVQLTIQRTLGAELPRVYSLIERAEKEDAVYQHMYEAYLGAGQGLYAEPVGYR